MKRILWLFLVIGCFGQNGLHDFAPSLGSGLNVNVGGGVAAISTVPTAIVGTSVGVAANTTTYIYVNLSTAIISSNTSGFTSTEYPVATVVTNSTQIVTLTDDRPGAYAVTSSGGSGAVSSVSNSDGTLTITPTTGAVIAALALAHANTWTGQQTFVAPILGTPTSGVITNLTGTCTSCTSNLAANISTNGTANQVWGMNSVATAQGWQTQIFSSLTTTGTSGAATLTGGVLNIPQYSGGGVTSIATTSPITGGTITTTGTIACATCVTSAASLTSTAIMTGAGSQGSQTPDTTATLSSGGVLAGVSMAENLLTGAAAAGTITEGGSTFSVTRAGVSAANLTAPWVFQNTNSTNNNTSITLGITSPGTSTGQTTLNINGATTGGDLTDWGTGGTWASGVLSGQTNVAKVGITGAFTGLNFTSAGTTAGFIDLPQGPTSAGVAPCNTANSHCIQAGTATTAGVETDAPALAQGIPTRTGTSSAVTDGYSGDANHSATVSWSTATSIGSTSLCSSANCPVGTYRVSVYEDVTTACTTTGSYVVNLIWTDDSAVSKTSVIPLAGLGMTSTFGPTALTGTLVPTSTTDFGIGSFILRSTGTTSINYSTTAGACATGGPGVGKLYFTVEPIQ